MDEKTVRPLAIAAIVVALLASVTLVAIFGK